MAIEPYESFHQDIHASAFVAGSADLIGRVTLHEESSVWYNTTLRGDINEIIIGPRSNIQDNAVVHLADDFGCYVGELVTVGHSAIIHACTIKDEVLIGMGSIILDHAVVQSNTIVAAGSVVRGKAILEPNSLYAGTPAKRIKAIEPEQFENMVKRIAKDYIMYAGWYK